MVLININTKYSFNSNKQGSRDNMSIIIITFPGAPKPSKDAIKAEEELENSLRKTIKGYYKKYFCRKIRTNI